MTDKNHDKVVLITGGARRVGAVITDVLHQAGYKVIIHYRHSRQDAYDLTEKLNQRRAHSAACLCADLDNFDHYHQLIENAYKIWNRIDALVNNASTFFKTPLGHVTEKEWDLLFNSNLKAPFFLSQAAQAHLIQSKGNIVNIVDIHAVTPMRHYPVYTAAKAGLHMLTKALAVELAPEIRVNAVAPGSVIWPESEEAFSAAEKKQILSSTLLQKQVRPEDIANAVLFLASQSAITGQMIQVDGGRF